jgi:hypothetical protein
MIVEIDKTVFSPVESRCSFKELQTLLNVVVLHDRYRLKLIDPSILESPYYDSLSQLDQQIVNESFDATINESLSTDRLIRPDGGQFYTEHIYNVQEGLIYLSSPIGIWLENSNNDSPFIRSIIRHLRPDIPIDDWITNHWLTFENAGGCSNARNALEEKLKENQGKAKMLRCFILLDGDKEFPDEVIHKYDTFLAFCQQNGFTCHVLHKRAMENYMPDAVFEEFRNNQTDSWISAYLRLTPEQKDYFNIAEGFNGNIRDKNHRNQGHAGRNYISEGARQLFLSVSDTNYERLEQGLSIANFKTQFPMKYEISPSVYAASLLFRTNHQSDPNELMHIIEQIIQLS